MEKLTDEQVNMAAKAANDMAKSLGLPDISGHITAEEQTKMLMMTLRSAAPFLQFPWDEPTDVELKEIAYGCARGVIGGTSPAAFRYALGEFVRHRNAVLVPKPFDLRRERVRAILQDEYRSSEEGAIDRIIAALDEVK